MKMTSRREETARYIAMAALNRFEPRRNYARPILNELLQQTTEKQRATDLVFGTIRNRSAIDTVISELADCPTERIPAKLLNIIRIAAYELVYVPQTAEYSIVNEAVENARAVGGKKQVGFVNAVLRQITRHIKNRQVPLTQAEVRQTLPQTERSGCEFDVCFLPEPGLSLSDYFSRAFSLPEWLVADWLAEYGSEKVRQICFASNRRPSVYVRPNVLRTTAQKLAEKFSQAGVEFEIPADGSMLKIKGAQTVTELPGFSEGLFSIQDMTASQAVRLLRPQSGWTILDLCSAPGGKATQLAELACDSARIIATDIDSQRLEIVRENISRLGISNVRVISYEKLCQTIEETGPFDCVLLDVPCSNTGVLARRPEARYRIQPKLMPEFAKIQRELLGSAITMLKPQGKICYSTCSIQKCENSELVREFLEGNLNLKLESEELTLPSAEAFDHDGGYAAVICSKVKS